jgi:uncharacterized membrane protein
MKLAAAYLAVAGVLLALDVTWILYVAHEFYASRIAALLADRANLLLVAFYFAAVTAAVVILAVEPAVKARDGTKAIKLGAVLGLVVFASFDVVSLAFLQDYSQPFALLDGVWDIAVVAVAARTGFAAVA